MTPNARNSTRKPEAATAAGTGTPDAGGLLAELRRLWAHQAAGPADSPEVSPNGDKIETEGAAGPAGISTGRGAMTGTPDGSTLATRDETAARLTNAGTASTAAGDGSTAPAARLTNAPPLTDRPTGTPRTAGPAAPAPGGPGGISTSRTSTWNSPSWAAPAPGGPAGISTATGDRPTGTPSGISARKPTAAELLAARPPRRCLTHTNPADWLDEPARNRPGYIRTVCRRCGCFLGYRPAEPEKRRRAGKAS